MNDQETWFEELRRQYPLSLGDDELAELVLAGKRVLYSKISRPGQTRYDGQYDTEAEFRSFGHLDDAGRSPTQLVTEVVEHLFSQVPRWRSPNLAYNVCAPTITAASAIYALALDENVHNVNSTLAGHTLIAERAVASIARQLGGLKANSTGLFTFGGTATNLYAMKIGTRKCTPESGSSGLDGREMVLIAEDAHFSHGSGADWLGIGTDRVRTMAAGQDRTTDLADTEAQAEDILQQGFKIAAILLNGGTTYGHTVDDIASAVELRDRLEQKYKLQYRPHIHVDSVIGWSWLVFRGYDFDHNPLGIASRALTKIQSQYLRIACIGLADSWGIDFHKGIGGAPASSSMIVVNNINDLAALSRRASGKTEMHQLAHEFSTWSPVDYTLETTRSAGAALAALVALQTRGLNGIRLQLASLVEHTILIKDLIDAEDDLSVLNPYSDGFVTMVGLRPPGLTKDVIQYAKDELIEYSRYMDEFFRWAQATRESRITDGEYSFSTNYVTAAGVGISAVKIYLGSPHTKLDTLTGMVRGLARRKKEFDEWKRK